MENTGTFIFGLRAIIEALEADQEIEKIYLQKDGKSDLAKQLNALLKDRSVSLSYVPLEKLNRLSKNRNHQGAVAKISPLSFKNIEKVLATIRSKKEDPVVLLLDRITDVRNIGAIIRTAECTGVDAIILPVSGSAPLNADSIKTSAGAVFNIPICKVNHLLDAVYLLQASGFAIVALTEKTENSYFDLTFDKPTALVLGSEQDGVSNSILKVADFKGKLPMLGSIDSLNVSVAAGVALYEIVRQRY